MATLTNTQISVTYVGLLKTSASTVLSSTAQQITDGSGNNSILFLSTAGVGIGGAASAGKEFEVTGNAKITGDLIVDNIKIDANTISAETGVVTLADGAIATTQSASDNSTKIATTAYVDAQVTAQDLDFSGTSGTGSVDLDSQTFAVVGTANEIETSAGSQQLQIGLPNDVTISNKLTVNTNLEIEDNHINQTTGQLKIESADSIVLDATGDIVFKDNNQQFAKFVNTNGILSIESTLKKQASFADTGVELYANDVKKLETEDAGVTIIGALNVDSVTSTGGATFGGTVTTSQITSSGNFTIDSALQIILDGADDGSIQLKDDGTLYGLIYSTSDDFYIKSTVSDGDIIFQGNDGGVGKTVLTLDMSENGNATFAGEVKLQSSNAFTTLRTGNDFGWSIYANSSNFLTFGTGAAANTKATDWVTIRDDLGYVGINETSPSNKLQISDSTVGTDSTADDSNFIKLTNKDIGTANEVWGLGFSSESGGTDYLGGFVQALGNFASNFNTSLIFGTRGTSGNATERMRIDSSGNVGIGVSNPQNLLSLSKAGGANIRFDNPTTNRHFVIGEGVGSPDKFSFRGLGYRSTDTMTIDFTNDRVGISTHSPGRKLTVAGDVSGDANNLLLSNENDTNGDTASIGFSMLSNNTFVKSGIFFERTTTQGRGSLHLAVNNEANSNNVSKSDAKLTIDTSGNLSLATATSLDFNVADFAQIRFKESAAITIDSDNNQSSRNFQIKDGSGSSLLTILDTGDATFAGNVKIGTSTTGTPSTNADDLVIDKGATESGITLISTNAATLRFGDAANTSIGFIEYNHNSNYMRFGTNAAERMRINSSGNVGIGAQSGGTLNNILQVSSGTNADGIILTGIGDSSGLANGNYRRIGFRFDETDESFESEIRFVVTDQNAHGGQMQFVTDNSSGTKSIAMTIDKNQNVGIGTTIPWLPLMIQKASSSTSQSADSSFRLCLSNSDQTNNNYALISFIDGDGNPGSAYMGCQYVDHTNNYGDILFGTRSASGLSEKKRITSAGFTKAKTGGNYFGGSYHEFCNNNNVSGDRVMVLGNTGGSATNNTSSIALTVADNANDRLKIFGNGNVVNLNNSYGASSDIKLKENIVDATSKLDDLMKVKIRNYNFIGDDKKQIGVVAQELEDIFPNMIDESIDYEYKKIKDKEGNITEENIDLGTTTKSVKYSVFVPMLIKAIQELKAEIETLKTQINK